ncbi:MAG: glycosyltransferase [Aquabacterium sp.]|uniref:glycosyltransferase n=1 Tax=Aquabacterium sp. TaxID=1872578 RepID=UPI0025B7F31B|nr:glycosyltransferase [Aquabacterium sp.]MBI3384434.1 glycosyltransferase [Aquabacterium sp.]
MRLALLSPLPPEQNGIADYAAHFRTSLNQAGVDVLTPLAGQRPIDSLAAARAWVAERDWRRVDVVHAELGGGRQSEFLTLCALASLPNRPALSATVHDPERLIWKPINRVWTMVNGMSAMPRPAKQAVALLSDPATLMAERKLARQLDGLVTLTQTGAGRLVKRMKLPVDRVSVISHGALTLPHKPLPPLDPIRLLYFGFIYSGKGIEDLIDAVGKVKAQQPELASRLRLTIAGGTSPDIAFGAQGSYLDQLRARVERRGLTPQVDWELDVDERDIPYLIQRHHLMVLPYRESRKLALLGQMRGTSGSLAWAIACGRGAITSDARAFAEEISHGNGSSYRQGDVAALAAQIEGVLNKPEILSQWADRASALAQERAWPMTGQRFVGHFQRAMARAPRARGVSSSGPASVWSQKESL